MAFLHITPSHRQPLVGPILLIGPAHWKTLYRGVVLTCAGVGGREEMQQLSQVLMADWVTMHAGQAWLQSGLLQLAHQVCLVPPHVTFF